MRFQRDLNQEEEGNPEGREELEKEKSGDG